jgi:hypothetical protein
MLLTFIRKVPCTYLARDIDYSDWDLSWYSSVLPCECRNSTLKLTAAASFNILSNTSFEAVSSDLLTALPSARNSSPHATYSLSLLLIPALGTPSRLIATLSETGVSAHYRYRKTLRAYTVVHHCFRAYVCTAVWATIFVIRAVIFDASRFFGHVAFYFQNTLIVGQAVTEWVEHLAFTKIVRVRFPACWTKRFWCRVLFEHFALPMAAESVEVILCPLCFRRGH